MDVSKLIFLSSIVGIVCGSTIKYSITEEGQAGSIVANILADSGVRERYPDDVLSILQFEVIQDEEDQVGILNSQMFMIDNNANMRTTQKIDRESICESQMECKINLDIQVKPIEYFQILKVEIEILDLNDNPPKYADSAIILSLSEAASIGSALTLPFATDPDSPPNGVKSYQLIGAEPVFVLNVKDNSDGSQLVQLILREMLDREQKSSYTFKVVAKDGGTPPKSEVLDIVIQVIDVNDNPTVFEQESYDVSIPEDYPVDRLVINVKATDADITGTSSLLYLYSDSTQKNYADIFRLDNSTGDIFLNKSLDYEAQSEYILDVKAMDRSPGAVPTVTKVTIQITDINDNAPKIKLFSLTSTGHAQISEFATRGSFVAHIKVKDPDAGQNGKFACTLNSDLFELEELYPTEFKLVTRATFDRELKSDYEVEITCEDNAEKPLISSKGIPITILDENDNTPEFDKESYKASILENSKAGESVIQITAIDKDFGDNALVKYSFDNNNVSAYFSINENTGLITNIQELNYEDNKSFTVHVIAKDSGNPSLSSSCLLVIKIIDTDDEVPTFQQTHYTFVVKENLPVQTEIGQVDAIDKDSDDFNRFHYALQPDLRHPKPLFGINRIDGMIYTEKSFDRESQSVHTLKVLAISEGIKPVTSTAAVTIYISDDNDHSPDIIFPSNGNDTIYIPSYLPQGEAITQIQAQDLDTGSNAHLQYSIESGQSNPPIFIMDTSSGYIFVGGQFHLEEEYVAYRLNIKVQDGGSPPKTASSVLNIIVNRSNIIDPLGQTNIASDNLTIVIVIACLSGLLVVILIVAIVAIIRQQRRKSLQKYNEMNHAMNHHITIQASNNDSMNNKYADNRINDNIAAIQAGIFPSKKSSNAAYHNNSDPIDETDGKRKKEVSFAMVNEACDVDDGSLKPLSIQTGSLDFPVEDKDSGCSMDTSNTDSGQGSDEVFEAASNSRSRILNNHPHRNTKHHQQHHHRRQRSQDVPTISTKQLNPGFHSNKLRGSYHGNETNKPTLPPRKDMKNNKQPSTNKDISHLFARDVLYRDLKKDNSIQNSNNVCKIHGAPKNRMNNENVVNLQEISSEVHV